MSHKDKYTFLELLDEYPIVIPLIQRDYAQGRLDDKAIDIRNQFLSDIIASLNNDGSELVLDFVYGSVKARKNNSDELRCFVPLDGQQRLTTLFLLHWYLMAEDSNRLNGHDGNSRFLYETRTSSTEFCKKLTEQKRQHISAHLIEANKERIDKNADDLLTLADIIVDQDWYLWAWNSDPTIRAMLVMLNDMHSRMEGLSTDCLCEMWNRLVGGAIKFNLLFLDKFNLTDELYVKMNARGKDLSDFDLLKSTLEEQMQKNKVSEGLYCSWVEKVNCKWMDFFWNNLLKFQPKDENGNVILNEEIVKSVERNYLIFLKRMMLFHLFQNDNCLDQSVPVTDIQLRSSLPSKANIKEGGNHADLLDSLREYSVKNDILKLVPALCRLGFFSEQFFYFIHDSLEAVIDGTDRMCITDYISDVWFEPSEKDAPQDLLQRFLSPEVTYEVRVQFFAVVIFAIHHSGQTYGTQLQEELCRWMRVVRNLSTNVNTYYYNTKDDFKASLHILEQWAEECYGEEGINNCTTYLSTLTDGRMTGFNREQLKEEKRKAILRTQNRNWDEILTTAENHPYFLGQIRFLLDGAEDDLVVFRDYFHKAECLFNKDGVAVDENRFRACLLCFGSYAMGYGSDGVSFLSGGKDRDRTWKRFLRDGKYPLLKELADMYDPEADPGLEKLWEELKKTRMPNNWRQYFVMMPDELFQYLKAKRISWWHKAAGEILLFSSIKRSTWYSELRTSYWYEKYGIDGDEYIENRANEGIEHPFSAVFRRNGGDVSVKFIPKWDKNIGDWTMGQYVVSSSFANKGLDFNPETNRWEHYSPSDHYQETENILENIL